ncbi:MAG TPA: transcription-repair coupling factor, partial [Legionellales bacterium]|nr:transcription-repair coupling factor [Legionellales bacterium]
QRYREQFPGNPNISVIYEHVSNQQEIQGLEYFLPLFFDKTETLFDYLPKDTQILYSQSIAEYTEKLWQEISIRYEQRRHDVSRPILKPEQLFLTADELQKCLQHKKHHVLEDPKDFELPEVQMDRKDAKPLKKLKQFLEQQSNTCVLIIAASLGRREVIHDLCKSSDIYPDVLDSMQDFIASKQNLGLIHGPLAEAYYFKALNILCITEHELFGETIVYQKQRRKKTISSQEKYIKDLSELAPGMPVVHVDYGVGRY